MNINKKDERASRRRIEHIRKKIASIDLACPGTLHERKKKCGRANCRCATDPKALHGPYFEWGWMEDGRLVHKILSQKQAKEIKKAIRNYRKIQTLLKQWGQETATIVLQDK